MNFTNDSQSSRRRGTILGRAAAFLFAGLLLCSPVRAGNISIAGTYRTADWNWWDPEHPWFVTYSFSGLIADHVDAVGNLHGENTRSNWRDLSGTPLQGDARYSGFTGTFRLNIDYYLRPNQLVSPILLSVQYNNGAAALARLGEDPYGFSTNTGVYIAGKLAKFDQNRMLRLGGPVQIGTGAESASRALFSFSGARNWGFELTYNSILASTQATAGAVGFGWTHPYEARVETSGSDLVLNWNNTQANTFTLKSGTTDTYISTEDAAQYDVLTTQAGGGWLLTRRDQSTRLFNSSGRLTEDRDPHGHKLVIAYNGSGYIATITDPVSSTSLAFTYVSGTQRIATITDASGAVVSLTYDSNQMLTTIVNQNAKQVTFGYDSATRALLTVTDHTNAVLTTNTYDAKGRVVAQDDGVSGNQPMSLAYAEQGLPGNNIYAASDTSQLVPLPLGGSLPFQITSFTRLDGQTIAYSYDANGRLTTAVVNGQTTTVNYDANGNAVSVTDPANQTSPVTQAIFVTATDRTGQPSVYTFDANYNLVSLKNPLNQTTSYTYDAKNNLTSVTDALNRTTSYTYDASGNVLTVTDPAGKVTTNTYDARNNLLTTTDPLGHVTTRTYDANNNLLTIVDALGRTTTWTYDTNSLPLTQTLPRGGVFHYAYTAGRLTQVTDPNGIVTNFSYDADGRVLYREDALGKRVTHTYDAIGNVLTIRNALNQTTTYTYDHRNRVHDVTEPTGAVTAYSYDANNNLLTTTDALGKVTTCTYDGEDRLKTIVDALSRTTTNGYDAAGRLTSVTDPANNVTTFEYDAAGQRSAIVDALGKRTTSAYDNRGLLTDVTDPLTRTAHFTYDDQGRRITARDPLNRTTNLAYDALNRLQQVTDPGSLVSAQAYDNDGNRSSLTNPANAATSFAYDTGGRLTGATTAGGRVTGQTYDTRGLPLTTTEPSTQATTLAYDDAARVSSTTDPVGTISYTRDADGRVLTTTEGAKVLTRVYDALGRLTSYTDGDGNVMGYHYDDIGRLDVLTYPDNKQVTYAYDTAGRLSTVTDWASRVTTYSYDAVGRVTQVLRPNGTKQTRSYDDAGQLLQLKEYAPDGTTVLYSGDYSYDAAGQLTGETLSPAISPQVGTILQTFDADNRLLTHNGAATTFDADGNLLTIASGVAPASYTYDARNRLTAAGGLTYTYDAENRRVALTDANGTTHYAINPNAALDQVLVRTAPDATKTFYVYGLGLLHEQTGSTVRYYHQDRRGDTVVLTDATGAVTDRASYGIYGELLSRTGTTNTPFLFNGRWGVQTDSSGLYYHRARYYHPALRRFLNQDTVLGSITTAASLNRFAYANGNPVTAVDPFGLAARDLAPNNSTQRFDSAGGNVGGTIFVPLTPAALGVGLSGSAGISAVKSSNGEILDTQFQVNVSISPLVGIGLAAYTGGGPNGGSSNSAPIIGFSTDVSWHGEGGYGFPAVTSISADWKPGDSWSGSPPLPSGGGRVKEGGGGAAYVAIGGTLSFNFTLPALNQMPVILSPFGGIPIPNPFWRPKK